MRIGVIPMKPLAGAKARLAPALAPGERRRISLAMLADVAAAAVAAVDELWVLLSDDDAGAVADEAGALAVPDPAPGQGLTASLDASTRGAIGEGATGVLVVSADLPAVTAEDLRTLIGSGGLALAPDAGGTGTNALWRSPGDAIATAFGPQSRAAHESLARGASLRLSVVERPGLAADVDTPAGLAAAWALGVGTHTRRALEEMDLAARLRLAG